MTDPTITPKDDTYTINIESQEYGGYTLQSCGHPIGRRTVVFQCKGVERLVIKEQYLRCSTEILEKTILNHIHELGEMPEVVRLRWCGFVKQVDGTSIECEVGSWKRQKVRFVLQGEGTPFMDISTPYEALATAWDVLEGEWCYLICKLLLMYQN